MRVIYNVPLDSHIYIVLYAPSSVQKLLDFLKTVYLLEKAIPVIIRPYGAAAQVGLPEAHRLSYKLNKPLIVLPELSDLEELLHCDPVYYVSEDGEEVTLDTVLAKSTHSRPALVISSGEQEPGKREIEGIKTIWIRDIPPGIPPVAMTGIIIYELSKILKTRIE